MKVVLMDSRKAVKAVSVSELKSNPSALKAAHEHPVVVLNHQRPEAVLVHLESVSILDELGIRLALATALYREESISLGRAARFSAVPLAEFIQYVSQLGIPVVRGTAASVRDDMDAIHEWEKSSQRWHLTSSSAVGMPLESARPSVKINGRLTERLLRGPFFFGNTPHMDRVAVFVDAGYLFAQGSQELCGAKLVRGEIALDHDAVTAKLKSFAEAASKPAVAQDLLVRRYLPRTDHSAHYARRTDRLQGPTGLCEFARPAEGCRLSHRD